MAAKIKKVGVLGAGLMGHGITQVAAQAGYDVVVREVGEEELAKGIGKVESQLARAVEKGKMAEEESAAVRGRIEGTTHYRDLHDCDMPAFQGLSEYSGGTANARRPLAEPRAQALGLGEPFIAESRRAREEAMLAVIEGLEDRLFNCDCRHEEISAQKRNSTKWALAPIVAN